MCERYRGQKVACKLHLG